MISTQDLTDQILDYLGTWASDYSIDGIIGDIFEQYPDIESIDDIDADDFTEILKGREL